MPDLKKGATGKVAVMIEASGEHEREGEDTRRVKKVVHDEIAPSIATVKRIQFWATIGLLVAGVGFGAAMYLNRYATASELDKLGEKQAATQSLLEQHMVNEAAKLGAIEAQGHNIESDYHAIRDQLWRMADRIGASRVAMPDHTPVVTPVGPARGDHR